MFSFCFSEEEIDEGAFRCLKYDMIKELIPKVGKRAKFVQKYEEYKESLTDRPAFGELQLDEKVSNFLRSSISFLVCAITFKHIL